MKYSLVIPCFNEAKSIPKLLERCAVVLENKNWEIVLVDNGSKDNTQEVLARLLSKYPRCRSIRVKENQGYGHGIVAGLNATTGDVIGWTHADLQTDPADALLVMPIFEKNSDKAFVKGRRYGRPFADVIFTIGMSIFETILLRKFMWDINAQPTFFSRKFFGELENPPSDFSLDLYFYFMAIRSGLTISRVPVRFGERSFGVSHWNLDFKSKVKFIIRTLVYSFKLRGSI